MFYEVEIKSRNNIVFRYLVESETPNDAIRKGMETAEAAHEARYTGQESQLNITSVLATKSDFQTVVSSEKGEVVLA